jgi:translation initiation factor 1A|tara:strand:+ start:422 stop:628 length:207 start_codon:yes stop_codon:yes gene_type:complete
MDGKQRNCRIPGRLKRRLWVRERDILLVEPWELGGDDKGDVVFKYKPIQVNVLRKKGLLKFTEDADEF